MACPTLPLHQTPVLKILDQLEVRAHVANSFAALFDAGFFGDSEIIAGHGKVFDLVRIDSHDPAAGGVDGWQIAAHHQNSGRFGRSLNRPVALHADDSIDDREAAAEDAV